MGAKTDAQCGRAGGRCDAPAASPRRARRRRSSEPAWLQGPAKRSSSRGSLFFWWGRWPDRRAAGRHSLRRSANSVDTAGAVRAKHSRVGGKDGCSSWARGSTSSAALSCSTSSTRSTPQFHASTATVCNGPYCGLSRRQRCLSSNARLRRATVSALGRDRREACACLASCLRELVLMASVSSCLQKYILVYTGRYW